MLHPILNPAMCQPNRLDKKSPLSSEKKYIQNTKFSNLWFVMWRYIHRLLSIAHVLCSVIETLCETLENLNVSYQTLKVSYWFVVPLRGDFHQETPCTESEESTSDDSNEMQMTRTKEPETDTRCTWVVGMGGWDFFRIPKWNTLLPGRLTANGRRK